MRRFRPVTFLLLAASLGSSLDLQAAYDPLHEQTNRWAWWFSGVLLGVGAGVGIGYAINDSKHSKKSKDSKEPPSTPKQFPSTGFAPLRPAIDKSTELQFTLWGDDLLNVKVTVLNPAGIPVAEEELTQKEVSVVITPETEKLLGTYSVVFEVVEDTTSSSPCSLGVVEATLLPSHGHPTTITVSTESREANQWTPGEQIVRYMDLQ